MNPVDVVEGMPQRIDRVIASAKWSRSISQFGQL